MGSDYNSPAGALQQLLEQQGMLGMSEQTLRDVQAQLQEAAGVENLSGTLEHYRAAERLLLEDACFIPLFYKQEYLVFRPDNEDLAFDPFTDRCSLRMPSILNSRKMYPNAEQYIT